MIVKTNNKKNVFVIYESVFKSILMDVITFGSLIFAMFANYFFCGNSKIMSAFFIFMLLSKGLSIYKKMPLNEAIELLKSMENEERIKP